MSKQTALKMSDVDESLRLPPLTRNGYQRSERTEADIRALLGLDAEGLVEAFATDVDGRPGHRCAEALVFFIRRAARADDHRTLRLLFAVLVRRCQAFFRGAIRGFRDPETRMDIQQEVLAGMTRLLLQRNDKADFLETRFWLHVSRRVANSARQVRDRLRHEVPAADLVQDGADALDALDLVADRGLAADDLAILKAGLDELPEDLRELFVLRHYEGWQIGNERGGASVPGYPTLAEYYGITPRAIHKRLSRAEVILARFRREQ